MVAHIYQESVNQVYQMSRSDSIKKIMTTVEHYYIDDRLKILRFMYNLKHPPLLNDSIREAADGTRVNLDKFTDDDIDTIMKFINNLPKIPNKFRI